MKNKNYNVGAGNFQQKGWTNIDMISGWYNNLKRMKNHINLDLNTSPKFPIEDNSAEIFFSSMMIEHLIDKANESWFKEAYRCLKKGGVIRLACPDADLYYRAYSQNDRDYFKHNELSGRNAVISLKDASFEQLFLWTIASNTTTIHSDGINNPTTDEEFKREFINRGKEDFLNFCTSKVSMEKQKLYPGNHINWYNFDKIKGALQNAGFTKIWKCGYKQSILPELRREEVECDNFAFAVFAEAIK